MDCFQDFCLACDKESTGGPYCSQACRLADLEKAGSSDHGVPHAVSTPYAPHNTMWAASTTSGAGLTLPAAYNFSEKASAYQRPTLPLFLRSQTSPLLRSPVQQSHRTAADMPRSLTPSSSRSSLSSTTSDSSSDANGGITEQAKLELQNYFSMFDRVAKRKPSLR